MATTNLFWWQIPRVKPRDRGEAWESFRDNIALRPVTAWVVWSSLMVGVGVEATSAFPPDDAYWLLIMIYTFVFTCPCLNCMWRGLLAYQTRIHEAAAPIEPLPEEVLEVKPKKRLLTEAEMLAATRAKQKQRDSNKDSRVFDVKSRGKSKKDGDKHKRQVAPSDDDGNIGIIMGPPKYRSQVER